MTSAVAKTLTTASLIGWAPGEVNAGKIRARIKAKIRSMLTVRSW